jgi:hypothetical protein
LKSRNLCVAPQDVGLLEKIATFCGFTMVGGEEIETG